MKKTILIIIVIVVLGGIGAYFYVFHKPHRDLKNEEASITEQANVVVDKYKEDVNTANTVYLDQVIEVKGVAAEVHPDHIILESGINCSLAEEAQNPEIMAGDEVTVKGRVMGYDDLFEEVRMDFCKVVQ